MSRHLTRRQRRRAARIKPGMIVRVTRAPALQRGTWRVGARGCLGYCALLELHSFSVLTIGHAGTRYPATASYGAGRLRIFRRS